MSKRVKYIISISVVVLLMTLGVVTLIMGLVPVGSNNAINVPDDVYIYTNVLGGDIDKIEYHRRDGDSGSEKVNKIFNLFNEGFEQKALSALFKGELGAGLEFVDNYDIGKSPILERFADDNENITIVFHYDTEQKVKNANTYFSGYTYLGFTINASSNWQQISFGLQNSINDDENLNNPVYGYQYSYEGKMVTSGLYNYVYSILANYKD